MQKYTDFQSLNHDLKLALACDETDDATCAALLEKRNSAAEAIYDDKFVDIGVKLKVAKIDCADRDHDATISVLNRLAA